MNLRGLYQILSQELGVLPAFRPRLPISWLISRFTCAILAAGSRPSLAQLGKTLHQTGMACTATVGWLKVVTSALGVAPQGRDEIISALSISILCLRVAGGVQNSVCFFPRSGVNVGDQVSR